MSSGLSGGIESLTTETFRFLFIARTSFWVDRLTAVAYLNYTRIQSLMYV
jgi:hypothetical protein